VARHVTSVVEVANALAELLPDKAVKIEGAPAYKDMVEKGIGTYLRDPGKSS